MEKQQRTSGDFWKEQMLVGNYEAAWEFSDRILQERKGKACWHLPRHQQFIWNGNSLENKVVLVRCYHGLGDTIQFIRYAPLLKKIAKRVIVWAQQPLMELLETVDGIDVLIPLHDGSPEVEYNADIEVMELPHYFRSTPDTIPASIPYIHTEPLMQRCDKQLFNVGITWKVSEWEQHRSIPFNYIKPLFNLPGIKMHVLQDNPAAAGWWQEFGEYTGPHSLPDFARIVKSLDLLITVDSMPAHLAGAQGVPVWVMLRQNVDWRWMANRNDSPWYPTARLFRQQEEGNWDPVIAKVREHLLTVISTRAR